MITLEQLLERRDRRAAHQRKLLEEWPGSALICLTVQLPGSEKRNANSLLIGGAGLAALLDKFGSTLKHVQVKDLETGYEAYLVVPLPALLVKRLCCGIEDQHPLGRLMDIDVMEMADQVGHDALVMPGPSRTVMPGTDRASVLDRVSIGLPPRKCLLCDNEVRYCMRAKTHTTEELLSRIDAMIKTYLAHGIQTIEAHDEELISRLNA